MPSEPNSFRTFLTLSRSIVSWILIGISAGNPPFLFAAEASSEDLERRFVGDVQPFLNRYCYDCHGELKQEGKLDLTHDTSLTAIVKNYRTWEIVVDRLTADEMPPKNAENQPEPLQRQAVIDWMRAVREYEAARNAGDPGTVLARRLSNAEYDNTIRDLMGVDIRPTREFPVDPANEAGFDNTGESLTMSPALVKKYLAAARFVADHLVLTPQGFEFAPHPVVTETDRDKYCVQQIVSFYQRHEVDFADYFLAAWRYQHREALGQPNASLSDFAERFGDAVEKPNPAALPSSGISTTNRKSLRDRRPLSPRYLEAIWSALTVPESIGPLAELQAEWQKIPADPLQEKQVRQECERLRDLVIKSRQSLDAKIEKLHVKGNSDGSQPLVLWWNRQIAAARMSYTGDGQNPELDAARARFCRIFPNAFSVSSRGHYADPNLGAQVRLLTAGFHLMQGYFRDDTPLGEWILDKAAKDELDGLWQNLNFVTLVPLRQYKDFLFFERAEPPQFAGGPEFDFARPENKDVTSQETLTRMREAYLAKARKNGASDPAIEAIETYFQNMSTDVRWIEETHIAAEPVQLQSLVKFAERAYRRSLTTAESDEWIAFYRSLRTDDGLNHEEALRDSIVGILMSPYFCFRFDLGSPDDGVRPLTDDELASRLSYFLWSSMPDGELLSHAAQGDLHQPAVLMSQTRRMLRDPRVRGLATEFAGNWLEFRRFEEHNSVDRERFASFTSELREAMYEEPLRLFMDVIRENRSVLDFLDAKDTFVNPVLARHYGIDIASLTNNAVASDDDWFHVEQAQEYGRGGLLAMSVFLTKNSPGLRTSPVKRGYWVVRRLLGEHIPPPPPEVPELPKDEAALGELTLPQLLARHRDHTACAGCHQRFDSIGLVFEGYGPIGERRQRDLAGHPVDATAIFPDGTQGIGLEGLRHYLITARRDDFIANLSRKLLSYALGRSLLLSDKQILEQIRDKLVANDHRMQSLVEVIVTSPQFLQKRGSVTLSQD